MEQRVTQQALEIALPTSATSKLERERRAFLRMLPDLLTFHRGQYVAVHDEQVADSGPNRVLCRVGNVDFYVGLVSEQPEPISRSGVRQDFFLTVRSWH